MQKRCKNSSIGVFLLLLAFSISASYSKPASAEGNIETKVQEAIVNYNIGKFDKSLATLKRLVKKIAEPSLRGQAYLYLGLSYGVVKKHSRAEKAFRQALLADPALQLDPTRTKESVIALFEKVREGLLGEIQISADRDDAMVFIDGKEAGKAPLRHTIRVGKHLVELRSPDKLYSWKKQVLVADKSTHTLSITLEYQGGWLEVTSEPAGAEITLGERKVGKTPLKKYMLAVGDYPLTLTLKGHRKYEKSIAITKGAVSKVEPKLEPIPVAKKTPPVNKTNKGKATGKVPPTKRNRIWTWVTAGTSLAVLGVGIGFGVASKSTYKDFEASTTEEDYNRLKSSVKRQSTIANVSYGVAGALAITSIILFFVEGKAEKKAKKAHRWQPMIGFGHAAVHYSF